MIDDDGNTELCNYKKVPCRIFQELLFYVHGGCGFKEELMLESQIHAVLQQKGNNFDNKLHGMNGVFLRVL